MADEIPGAPYYRPEDATPDWKMAQSRSIRRRAMVKDNRGYPPGGRNIAFLANIYLHYALDLWVDQWRRKATGDVIIVRYADDLVTGFQRRGEAERFLKDL